MREATSQRGWPPVARGATRVAKARELLEATRIPIEGVATETGFGSADAMRHHFRQRLGTSPANYRAAFRVPVN